MAIFLVFRQKLHGLHGRTHAALAIGLFLWLSADIVWAIYQLVLEMVPPIPSLADYLWLSGYAFLGYYLYGTFWEFQKRFNFGKRALVASAVCISIYLAYVIMLTASLSVFSSPKGIATFAVIVAYPILDAALMVPAIVILVEFRKEPVWFIPWVCESLGIFLIAVSDSWFALVVLTSLVEQLWLSSLFFAAHFLVMAAGLLWYIKFILPHSKSGRNDIAKNPSSKAVPRVAKRITRQSRVIFILATCILAALVTAGLLLYPSSPLNMLSATSNTEVIAPITGGNQTVMIGALLPLTGATSSLGESENAALKIAVNDVNSYFAKTNSNVRVGLIVEDTRTNPAVALDMLKKLAEQGVKIVVGPGTSADLQQVKDYADSRGILIVSPSSTAPSLANPGDNVFRFVPDDTHQAQAISAKMWHDGIQAIVPFWRTDVYGNDLVGSVRSDFIKLGGVVSNGVGYAPRTGDFSTSLNRITFIVWQQDLKSLSNKLSDAVKQYGASKVGVYMVSFDEVVPIFIQAQNDPALSQVKWYGSDGAALNDKMVRNSEAARFAVQTNFVTPIYGAIKNTEFNLVDHEVQQLIGRVPRSYVEVAYDAFWVASLTEKDLKGIKDINLIKKKFVQIADSYTGTTGNTSLNQAGDRKFGDYDFWAVKSNIGYNNGGNSFEWKLVGRFYHNMTK